MWGEHAVGKLVAGADALSPQIEVFVDETAGPDVAQKVERRLQHFISRKIQALFEPLINLQKDEAVTGVARGFAFRMVEGLGILPRAGVAQEVKDLDQDARGALRKHGIRFGQFTIFMPLLLKPAPTRLRLLLWSLANGLQEFPEAPPPGLVTVPSMPDAPEGYDTMAGYRSAGQRMIRIDMLERLADLLRNEDSRGGFEAKPDMLSITGMTLEQFSDLMQGLGYRAEKGERVKVKAVDEVVKDGGTPAADQPVMDAAAEAENTPAAAPVEGAAADAPADVPAGTAEIVDEGVAPMSLSRLPRPLRRKPLWVRPQTLLWRNLRLRCSTPSLGGAITVRATTHAVNAVVRVVALKRMALGGASRAAGANRKANPVAKKAVARIAVATRAAKPILRARPRRKSRSIPIIPLRQLLWG